MDTYTDVCVGLSGSQRKGHLSLPGWVRKGFRGKVELKLSFEGRGVSQA